MPSLEQMRLNAVRAELASLTTTQPLRPFNEVQKKAASFSAERPLMKEHNTPLRMAEWLQEETAELLAEMKWGEEEPTEEQITGVRSELADVVMLALNIGNDLGIDVGQAVIDKIANNEERFPKELFQDTSQNFTEVYLKRKVELGQRPHTVLQPGVEVKLGLDNKGRNM